jgi:hypothetical protein
MSKKPILILISSLFIFSVFLFTPGVLANVMTLEERNAIREQKRQELLERKEARDTQILERRENLRAQLCERHASRIATKTRMFESIRKGHTVALENMIARLEMFADRFEERGYDVDGLRAEIEVLKVMVAEFNSLHAQYIGTLEGADYSCGFSEGAYARALDQAKEYLPGLRAKLAEIRTFLQTEIRAELLALRGQVSVEVEPEAEMEVEIEEEEEEVEELTPAENNLIEQEE